MEGTEKRMEYYQISKNIVGCKNFLPPQALDFIYAEILNNRNKFDVPSWSNKKKEFFSSHCGGLDFWDTGEHQERIKNIVSLNDFFLHQGFFQFCIDNNLKMFSLLERETEYNIHVITYNNGGYYNWHKDSHYGTIFTFNLVLNKNNSLEGGDMLFMDEGEIIKVKNQNNFMVVFPAFVDHAITPLVSKNKKDVPFLEQRFSIQHWVRLVK